MSDGGSPGCGDAAEVLGAPASVGIKEEFRSERERLEALESA